MLKVLLWLCLGTTALWAQAPPDDGSGFEWKDRWSYYLHRTYSWQRMSFLAVDSALDHLMGEPVQWGRDPECYTWRYGSAFGQRMVRNTIELGAGAAFGEDARFRPSHAHSLRTRMKYAAVQAFTSYRGGRRTFSYSRLAGAVGGSGIPYIWEPCPFSASLLAERIASSYLDQLGNSFLNEFSGDLKAFGRKMQHRMFGRRSQ